MLSNWGYDKYMPTSNELASPKHRFATTRWSIVLAASHRKTSESDSALETLCQSYWYPLYAYVRRQGYQPAEAQDAVQEFFAKVLEKEYLAAADQQRGRFRSFLLTVFKRFLSNEKKRDDAQKRGGSLYVLSLDFEAGERRLQMEPACDWTPEKVYERRWALTLLDEVLCRLDADYEAKGKSRLFEQLKVFLTDVSGTPPYAEIAESLDMTEGAVKVAVHRLREQYRAMLRQEVANTVAEENDVDDELNCLLAALSGMD